MGVRAAWGTGELEKCGHHGALPRANFHILLLGTTTQEDEGGQVCMARAKKLQKAGVGLTAETVDKPDKTDRRQLEQTHSFL